MDLKIDEPSRNNTAFVIIRDSGEVGLAAAFASMLSFASVYFSLVKHSDIIMRGRFLRLRLQQRLHTRTVVGESSAGSGVETDLPACCSYQVVVVYVGGT